jgi:hypothetical protein
MDPLAEIALGVGGLTFFLSVGGYAFYRFLVKQVKEHPEEVGVDAIKRAWNAEFKDAGTLPAYDHATWRQLREADPGLPAEPPRVKLNVTWAWKRYVVAAGGLLGGVLYYEGGDERFLGTAILVGVTILFVYGVFTDTHTIFGLGRLFQKRDD